MKGHKLKQIRYNLTDESFKLMDERFDLTDESFKLTDNSLNLTDARSNFTHARINLAEADFSVAGARVVFDDTSFSNEEAGFSFWGGNSSGMERDLQKLPGFLHKLVGRGGGGDRREGCGFSIGRCPLYLLLVTAFASQIW